MDQFTRRIIGVVVQRGAVDGLALCRMFNRAIRGQAPPKYVSSDHDPLYRFQQWQANLRILGVTEIKTVPYVPLSHPFIERLIGTIRRECLDRTLFWTALDLEAKLLDFQRYFNKHRTHSGLNGRTPETNTDGHPLPAGFGSYMNGSRISPPPREARNHGEERAGDRCLPSIVPRQAFNLCVGDVAYIQMLSLAQTP